MKLMELNWQKSRYLKIITADECTRSEVRVGGVQTHDCVLPKPWNIVENVVNTTIALEFYHWLLHHPNP